MVGMERKAVSSDKPDGVLADELNPFYLRFDEHDFKNGH